jgi:hypothetical protein
MHLFRSSVATLLVIGLPVVASSDTLTVENVKEMFAEAQLVSDPVEVDCTLSGGAETTCIQITVVPAPTTYEAGPWCPTNVEDGPENAGIWFYEGGVVDADGAFFSQLALLYDDENWQIVDPDTGNISYTATLEACDAAARPDVAEEYQNNCVQCLIEYIDEDLTVTYSFPVDPVVADETSDIRRTSAGVAFNGIRIDGPAPVEDILAAYTIAVFDDCGGHVNLPVGYHYHAVTDCLLHTHDGAAADDHAPVVGLALDGHFITTHLNADGSTPEDLDACYGHSTDELGYHYHAGAAGTNQNLGCLTAQTGCSSGTPGEACDATARRERP